ncbi:MAG: UbiD family decarboxylase [Gemmataceae bacterium]|nr:UbiD family decarboxylase [Gemmataceae bacterium]
MSYRSLRECVEDLERHGQLRRIAAEVDPDLELAEIQRRAYRCQAPALLFERVRGCSFPVVCNLFGTLERTRWLFRDTLTAVRHLVELKIDPAAFWRNPWRYRDVPRTLWNLRPKYVRSGPIQQGRTTIRKLPPIRSWPKDGGPFVTLPQVYTEDPRRPGWRFSNLGMYRIQLSGNDYQLDHEIGLHYQIHRGIGVHHAAALECGKPLRVTIAVGGPPAMTVAAVMPLPEGLPELAFAGALGGRRVRLIQESDGHTLFADADFCITGTVDPERLLPEGPFGDHLGYYSLTHPFPVLRVDGVYHRADAIWPFTVVGRPPQEDTSFGELIHELTGPVIPTVIAGLKAVHAVDAAGVHPLLLAIGSERYVPYAQERRPQELLTIANAVLGQGQLSLAKYLLIVAGEDDPDLNIHDIPAFLRHLLCRIDWRRDLHFQTRTTIDTLDYSGTGFNEGSKVVMAASGKPRRELPQENFGSSLPRDFDEPRLCLPGVLAIRGPSARGARNRSELEASMQRFVRSFTPTDPINRYPLIVVVDDSDFTARELNNFLWVVFTRSDPASDIYGIGEFIDRKHWGCEGSLVIDARIKPHHAPPVEEDPEVTRRVNEMARRGGPLYGIID